MSEWTQEQVEKWIERKKSVGGWIERGYAHIPLPHGLELSGMDRKLSFDIALADIDLSGKSFLDIGCHLGHMLIYAHQAGCTQLVGLERSKSLAGITRDVMDMCDVPAKIVCGDIERNHSLEPAQVVCMFNVIHHLNRPVATIRKVLTNLTINHLIIEYPDVSGRFCKRISVPQSLGHQLTQLPVIGVEPSDVEYYFSESALRAVVRGCEGEYDVRVFDSPMADDRRIMCISAV